MQALHPADPAALTVLPRGKSMPARPRARLHPHPAPPVARLNPPLCIHPPALALLLSCPAGKLPLLPALAALLPTDAPQHPHHYPPTSQQADKSKSWQVGKLASTRAGESSPRLSRLNVPPPPLSFQFITPRRAPAPRLHSSCERPAALTPSRPPSPGISARTRLFGKPP